MKKIKELYLKHKELILYVIFGVLTTLVNLITFMLCEPLLGESLYLVSNFIAWVAAVIFAYIVNKIFVFSAKSWKPKDVLREGLQFLAARIFSFLLEEAGLFLFVDLLGFKHFEFKVLFLTVTGSLIAKIILAVVVIILNYFFSKLIIFKKSQGGDADAQNQI